MYSLESKYIYHFVMLDLANLDIISIINKYNVQSKLSSRDTSISQRVSLHDRCPFITGLITGYPLVTVSLEYRFYCSMKVVNYITPWAQFSILTFKPFQANLILNWMSPDILNLAPSMPCLGHKRQLASSAVPGYHD